MQTTDKTTTGDAGDLNHPHPETWMGYVYGECAPEEQARLAAHLNECAQCRANVAGWQNAMNQLDQYQLPERSVPARSSRTALKWGIAAGLILLLGFGLGRAVPSVVANSAALRAAIKDEVRAEMLAETRERNRQWNEFKNAQEAKTAGDNKVFLARMGKMETDRARDYASLHKELETVALLTDLSLQQAQREIVSLAGDSRVESQPQN